MKNLFVGNMSFHTIEGDLRGLFEPFGQVTRVHIAMDRDSGRSRGFAFVEVPDDAQAAQAIAGLDGKEFSGRNLKVNEARPREAAGPRARPASGTRPGFGNAAPRTGRNGAGRGGRSRASNDDYADSARQPREPRW